MQCSSACMHCLVHSHYKKVKNQPNEELKKAYMRGIMELMTNSTSEDTAPYLSYKCDCLFEEIFKEPIEFAGIKKEFNEFVLSKEDEIVSKIKNSEDPLKTSIIFARIGNYIDFGAMETVSKKDFLELFDSEKHSFIPKSTYKRFLEELDNAESFLLIADNCGEIVLDRFFLQELKIKYPNIKTTLLVKENDVLNDATEEDALQAGFFNITEIINTGNGIAGCDPRLIGKEAIDALDSHSIILSKGQANFETLFGTGKNIYYSFLCKCDYFAEKFQVEPFSGMFIREKDFHKSE